MPCQFTDAAQESTAAQLCPSGLKSSLLVHLATRVVTSMAQGVLLSIILSFFAKRPMCLLILPVLRTSLLFTSDISATFLQCTMPRHCWNMNLRLHFPGQSCLVVLSLFLCTLQAWGFQLPELLCHCNTSSSAWHVMARGKPELQHCFFSSIGCGEDQQQLPSICSTINVG